MTQKRLLSTGAALLAALCLLLALSGCGGEKPLLDQPIKTLTCVEPTALPTLVPLGDGRVLAGWVDYENEMTHLSVVDVAADKELAAQTLEGCWELQTEQFTDGSAVLFNWDGGAWQFIDASLTVTKTFHAEQYGGVFSHDGGTYYFVQDDVLCRADVASGQTERVPLSSELRFMDVAGIFPDSETLFLHCLLSPYSTESGTVILDTATGEYAMLQKEWYAPYYGQSGPEFLRFNNQDMGYDVLYPAGDQYYQADAALLHASEADLFPLSGSPYLLGAADDATLYRLESGISACLLSSDQLGGTFRGAVWLHKEHRIIAEAPFPHGGKGDGAVAVAVGGQHVAVGEGAADGRMEMGGTVRRAPHVLQQQSAAGRITVQIAVPGGVDARRAL